MKAAGKWGGLSGLAGFLIGFVGPIVFNPEANQGPLLGIFITGPGGFVFGVLLGVLPLSDLTRLKILVGAASAGILAMFILGGPQPLERGRIWEAEIASCESPAALIPAALEKWEQAVARTTWAAPRDGWKTMADAMPGFDPGVVVTLAFPVGSLKEGRRLLEPRVPHDPALAGRSQAWEAFLPPLGASRGAREPAGFSSRPEKTPRAGLRAIFPLPEPHRDPVLRDAEAAVFLHSGLRSTSLNCGGPGIANAMHMHYPMGGAMSTLEQFLERSGGRAKAAILIGIAETTLWRWMQGRSRPRDWRWAPGGTRNRLGRSLAEERSRASLKSGRPPGFKPEKTKKCCWECSPCRPAPALGCGPFGIRLGA